MQNSTTRMDGGSERNDELSTKVVEEIARVKDVDPLDLAPLYDVIDPDALDDLATCSTEELRIEFEYEMCTVTVRGDGHVHVE